MRDEPHTARTFVAFPQLAEAHSALSEFFACQSVVSLPVLIVKSQVSLGTL